MNVTQENEISRDSIEELLEENELLIEKFEVYAIKSQVQLDFCRRMQAVLEFMKKEYTEEK